MANDAGECIRCLPNSFISRRLRDGKKICVLNLKYATSMCELFNYDTSALNGDDILKRYSLSTTAEKASGLSMLNINTMDSTVSNNTNHFCTRC